MAIELGIMVDLSTADEPTTLTALAKHADARGLDLMVVSPGTAEAPAAGLDPWTTAVWLAARTPRIAVGFAGTNGRDAEPGDPQVPPAAVVAKARDSADVLVPGRILLDGSAWQVAPADADQLDVTALAQAGRPVVVPVASMADVDRVAELGAVLGRDGWPRRSVAARARRMPGIDYDGVPQSLADTAVEPGDTDYRAVASTYLRGGAPGLVLRPRTPAEVAEAVAFARRHTHLPLGIRSAGHGISGRSTNRGGLVIDVGAMNRIEVIDADRRLVRMGPGATWKQVSAALDTHGWALGSGDYGGVGVGGLATAGGIGFLSRQQGLTIDRLRAVELVLADGTAVRASDAENPDLFWAVRGAGANFGIATAFEFAVDELGDVGWAQLVLVADDLADALHRYGQLASAAPRDTTMFLVTGRPRRNRFVLQLYGVVAHSDPDVVVTRLRPFLQVGELADQHVAMTSYAGVMAMAPDVGPDGHQGSGEPVGRSGLLPDLTVEAAHELARLMGSGGVFFLQLRAMGGAIADVPADRTAFAQRNAAFQLAAVGADEARLERAWGPMRRHLDGLYLSFETDRRPERLADAFGPPVLARLRALKRRYDPGVLFRDNFPIDPFGDLGAEAAR